MSKPKPPTTAAAALVRALAAALAEACTFDDAVADDAAAVRLVVDVVHGGGCPDCGGRSWRPSGARDVDCDACGNVPALRATPLSRRRLRLRFLLEGVFRVFHATDTTTARGWSRTSGVRADTCLDVLHLARAALPPAPPPTTEAAVAQVLGRERPANVAFVAVALDVGGCAVASVVAAPSMAERAAPPPQTALVLGQLRAWLTTCFRGVSARRLGLYVREFNARLGRAAWRELVTRRMEPEIS